MERSNELLAAPARIDKLDVLVSKEAFGIRSSLSPVQTAAQ